MTQPLGRNGLVLLIAWAVSLAPAPSSAAEDSLPAANLPPAICNPQDMMRKMGGCGNREGKDGRLAFTAPKSKEECEDECYKKFLPSLEECREDYLPGANFHNKARCEFEFKQKVDACVDPCIN